MKKNLVTVQDYNNAITKVKKKIEILDMVFTGISFSITAAILIVCTTILN